MATSSSSNSKIRRNEKTRIEDLETLLFFFFSFILLLVLGILMFYLGLFSFSFTRYIISFIFYMFSFFLFYVFSQVLFTMLLFLIVICLCAHKCQSSIKIYIYILSRYIVYIIEENDLRNYEESFCQNENYANFVFLLLFNIFTYLYVYLVYRINNLTKLWTNVVQFKCNSC